MFLSTPPVVASLAWLPAMLFVLCRAVAALLLCTAVTARAAEPVAWPAGSPQAETIRFALSVHYLAVPAEDPVLVARDPARRDARRLKLVARLPAQASEPVMAAGLRHDAVTPDLPPTLQRSQRVLRLEFAHPRAQASDALRVATKLVEQVARDTGGLLWDESTRELFTPDEWRRARADPWADEGVDVARQVALQADRGADGVRLATRGMAKLGLPDIAIERVPAAQSRSMTDLLHGLAQALAEGAGLPRAGEFDLDLRALRQPDANARQKAALKAGAGGVARLSLMQVSLPAARDDGEASLMEVQFDRQPGADAASRQLALLRAAYGAGEAPVAAARPPSVEEVARALAGGRGPVATDASSGAAPGGPANAARARLPALREAFAAGLPPRETIQLKAPFAVAEGGVEWMWVEVLSWNGDAVVGVLKSQPRLVQGLAAGQIVNLRQRDVVDYLHRRADGTQEGNASATVAR